MESGKADNPLNLALSTPEAMREKSIDLNTGFQEETRRWELIVKYHGDLEELAGQLGFEAVPLLNSYAVITIDERRIPALLASEQRILENAANLPLFFPVKPITVIPTA